MIEGVYTTGQAAKICRVSQQTIIRCFDTGQLKGFRVPGSRVRRIPYDVMHRFMRENGIPMDLVTFKQLIVVIAKDDLRGPLNQHFDERYELISVSSGFEAGIALDKRDPYMVVVDCRESEGVSVAKYVSEKFPKAILCGVKFDAPLLVEVPFTFTITAMPESTPSEIASQISERAAA